MMMMMVMMKTAMIMMIMVMMIMMIAVMMIMMIMVTMMMMIGVHQFLETLCQSLDLVVIKFSAVHRKTCLPCQSDVKFVTSITSSACVKSSALG